MFIQIKFSGMLTDLLVSGKVPHATTSFGILLVVFSLLASG